MSKNIISVIIINYNTGLLLNECVQSVLKNREGSADEIIIIDNASADQSLEEIRSLLLSEKGIKVINNNRNCGFSVAVNQGIKLAKGDYLVLLNPDTRIKEGALKKLKEVLINNSKVGCCGPKLLNQDLTLQMSVHPYPNLIDIFFDQTHLSGLFPKSKIFSRFQMRYWDHAQMREVDWMSGACLMIRKEVIKKIGLLDERFFMFCEDIDLCLRVKQAGWQNFYVPDACVIHLKGKSSVQLKGSAPVGHWVSLVMFWAKHKGKANAHILRCFLCLDALAKFFIVVLLKIGSLGKIPEKKTPGYFGEMFAELIKVKI